MKRVERRLIPPKLKNIGSYKPYLRIDFRWSCAYCTRHEAENGGHYNFEIDHFRPMYIFPRIASTYFNLYYSCRKCNRVKSDTWPNIQLRRKGFRFVDPCLDEPTKHFEIWYNNGLQIEVKSKPGSYTVEHLMLRWRNDITELHKTRYIQKQRLNEVKSCIRLLIHTLRSETLSIGDRELLLSVGKILRDELVYLRKAVSGRLDPPY